MEAEFVAEGLVSCLECDSAFYCSNDCRQWHWTQGGHRYLCERGPGEEVEWKQDIDDCDQESLNAMDTFDEKYQVVGKDTETVDSDSCEFDETKLTDDPYVVMYTYVGIVVHDGPGLV